MNILISSLLFQSVQRLNCLNEVIYHEGGVLLSAVPFGRFGSVNVLKSFISLFFQL
jgi:hypothetical protein